MYTLSKLSLAACVAIAAAFVAEKFGILEMRYLVIIAIISATVQVILLIILMATVMTKYRKVSGVRMTRYKFCDRFIKGNENILPEHISTTNPRKSAIFKILLEIKYTGDLPEIVISKKGFASLATCKKNHDVNIHSGMLDDSLVFDADIAVKPGEEINLLLKKDALVKSFFLGEFYVP
jgi:uncharacterized membrane protein YcgQ (UPF0703/DUF1980 family)